MPPKTILEVFISDSFGNYVEPERKGTPKGHQIGPSRKKFQAALLTACTNRSIQEIAKTVGVSYSLLAKWRTEDIFRNVVDNRINRFVDLYFSETLWKYYLKRCDDTSVSNEKVAKAALNGVRLDAIPETDDEELEELSDVTSYSSQLIDAVTAHIESFFVKHGDAHIPALYPLIEATIGMWNKEQCKQYWFRAVTEMKGITFDVLEKFVSNLNPTEKERAQAINAIYVLKKVIYG